MLNYVRHSQRRTLLVVRHDSPRIPRELSPLLAAETGRPLVVATVSDAQSDPMSAAMAAVPDGRFEPGTILSITGAEDLAVSSPDENSASALYEFARRLDLRRDQYLPTGGVIVVWATERVFDALAEHALNFISLSSSVLRLAASGNAAQIARPITQSITFETLRDRYRIPPLPADSPDELRTALNAFEELAVANELYVQGGVQTAHALARFDAAHEDIEAAWHVVSTWKDRIPNGSPKNESWREFAESLLIAFPGTGAHVLGLRLHPRQRIAWLENALTAARRHPNHFAEAGLLGNLGIAWADLGDDRKARGFYEEQIGIALARGNRPGLINGLGNLANTLVGLGEPQTATALFAELLTLAREQGDRRAEARGLGGLGVAWKNLGRLQDATDCLKGSLEIARETEDRWAEKDSLGNLGVISGMLGNMRQAIGYLAQSLKLAEALGHRRGEAVSLGNLGSAWAALDEPSRALEFYDRQLAIACQIGDQRSEADALYNSALTLEKLGMRADAIARAENAAAIYSSTTASRDKDAHQLIERLRSGESPRSESSFSQPTTPPDAPSRPNTGG